MLPPLSDFLQAAQLAEREWAGADLPAKRRLAPMAANAWWRGGRLDAMRGYLGHMDEKTVDGAFCRYHFRPLFARRSRPDACMWTGKTVDGAPRM